jgi:predicted GIY-YIG superfamily endonuclease
VKLVHASEFRTVAEAFAAEKKVQNWSRAKREALIRGDFGALPGLSRKRWK